MLAYGHVCLAVIALTVATTQAGEDSALTNAAQVRALSISQASRHLPVRLRGIFMGQTGSPEQGYVIADSTEGIYLEGAVSNVSQGEIVEVEGVTDPGGFAPFVRAREFRVVGEGHVPPPRPVTLGELSNGGLDAQWVEVSGVVRSCEPMLASERPTPPPGSVIPTNAAVAWNQRKFKICLASGDERLAVQVNDELEPEDYIDASVRLRGICFSQHNATRQFLNPLLLVPHGVRIQIENPPETDPFALPTRSVATLLAFDRQNDYGHRVHVRGVVTFQKRGEFLWLRDGDRGLRAASSGDAILRPGDEVDVAGFPASGQYTPVLEDAVFRRVSRTLPPAAIPLTNFVAVFKHDADLVQIDATCLDSRPGNDENIILDLDWDGLRIEGRIGFDALGGSTVPPSWLPGSRVRVAGICSILTGKSGPVSGIWEPQSFELLLRSPSDLTVLQPPSWWTYQHLMLIVCAVASFSILVVARLIWMARRRLRDQQNQRVRAEAEFAAILAERNRMAREIHDTLAQGLAAISVRLRLAKKQLDGGADPVAQHNDLAQQLVRESLEEARNSIWNMRPHVLENSDLAGALEGVLRQLADGTGVEADLRVTGNPRRLAPMIENNLLRVGQEAITNATRHARARHISVLLDYSERQFHLRVSDDGHGFDAAQPPPGEGGFGLVGIRERAAQLKGDLAIQSAPGKGTEIRLAVPLGE